MKPEVGGVSGSEFDETGEESTEAGVPCCDLSVIAVAERSAEELILMGTSMGGT
jgi:hypothetical protein